MLFGLSKSAEKTPCLNKKWYQGSICLDTKIIFKTENNIKNQGSACKKKIFSKLKIISRTWMSPAPSPASLLVLNFHQNLEVLFKRFFILLVALANPEIWSQIVHQSIGCLQFSWKLFLTPKKMQPTRISPFAGALRALGSKSEETIKANSASIVEILQNENSNKLS